MGARQEKRDRERKRGRERAGRGGLGRALEEGNIRLYSRFSAFAYDAIRSGAEVPNRIAGS